MLFPDSRIVAGCDEAGRGALAGNVFAASVIFPKGYSNTLIKDSKKLSQEKRNQLRKIIEKDALAFAIGIANVKEIEKLNILHASLLAVHRALDKLSTTPEYIIMDGNYFKPPYKNIPAKTIIKGDDIYLEIAAASILAKTYRDEYMLTLHNTHSCYHWDKNKGYPTVLHRQAIKKFGASPYHRKKFALQKRKTKKKK